MEGSTQGVQDTLPENRKDNVTFKRDYDAKLFRQIAKESGSYAVLSEVEYIRTARWQAGEKKFVSELIGDGLGFYAGTIQKKHFRLVMIAIRESEQGKGYGAKAINRIMKQSRKLGLEKITLRTSRSEGAAAFYKRFGGKITGINGDDYEMEIPVCFTS